MKTLGTWRGRPGDGNMAGSTLAFLTTMPKPEPR
jgi:hypothetical protein